MRWCPYRRFGVKAGNSVLSFDFDEILRRDQLFSRIIRHAKHNQRRGCLSHRTFVNTLNLDRLAMHIALTQKNPVMQHIRLIGDPATGYWSGWSLLQGNRFNPPRRAKVVHR